MKLHESCMHSCFARFYCKFSVSHRRAKDIIEEQFVSMCVEEQDILGSATAMQKFLSLFLDEPMRQELERELQNHSTSIERWEAVVRHITERRQKVAAMYLTFVILLLLYLPKCDILFAI